MKKILFLILCINLVFAKVHYIGVVSGAGKGVEYAYILNTKHTIDYTSQSVGVKYGIITKNNNKIEIALTKINQKASQTDLLYHKNYIKIDINYLWVWKFQHINPLFGVGVDNISSSSAKVILGGSYDISNNMELEITYQKQYIIWSISNSTYDVLDSVNVGLNYKF
jgi:opacity protein-like surface antigen